MARVLWLRLWLSSDVLCRSLRRAERVERVRLGKALVVARLAPKVLRRHADAVNVVHRMLTVQSAAPGSALGVGRQVYPVHGRRVHADRRAWGVDARRDQFGVFFEELDDKIDGRPLFMIKFPAA